MKKPTLKTKTYLNYSDCRKWISLCLDKDINYWNKGNKSSVIEKQDFGAWLLSMENIPVCNGFFRIRKHWINHLPTNSWKRIIVNKFFEEFSEYVTKQEELEFWIGW